MHVIGHLISIPCSHWLTLAIDKLIIFKGTMGLLSEADRDGTIVFVHTIAMF